jgi:DNA-binding response OmpR family regulator
MAKILIVEDDEFLADLMQDCLAASDYDVRSVGTGGDALKELESDTFNVVLLDWQLPDMDGLEVLKTYRQKNGAAKVVMLTGMRGRKDDGMESGADKFLMKPFKIDEILAAVREFTPDA